MNDARQLSERDQAILEFERLQWRYQGAKAGAVLEQFGLSFPRYSQVLNRLLDDPAALAYDATTVRRLRRLRDQSRAARSNHRATKAI